VEIKDMVMEKIQACLQSFDEATWTRGWRRFSKRRFNTSNRAIDSLDCFCATLSYIVEGNDLKGITNVVVQFGNSLQPPHYRFMSFMSFTHGLQEK